MDSSQRLTFKMPVPPIYRMIIDGEEYLVDLMQLGDSLVINCVQNLPNGPTEPNSYLAKQGSRKAIIIEGRIKGGEFVEEEREYSLV